MIKLSELNSGDTITIDGGFTCAEAGEHTVLKNSTGLCFRCADGLHYLDGQQDDNGNLVGVTKHVAAPRAS